MKYANLSLHTMLRIVMLARTCRQPNLQFQFLFKFKCHKRNSWRWRDWKKLREIAPMFSLSSALLIDVGASLKHNCAINSMLDLFAQGTLSERGQLVRQDLPETFRGNLNLVWSTSCYRLYDWESSEQSKLPGIDMNETLDRKGVEKVELQHLRGY